MLNQEPTIQTVIEGVQPPPRPKLTDDIVRIVAQKMAEELGMGDDDGAVDDLVKVYSGSQDGYEIGRELEKWHGWSMDFAMAEKLDNFSSRVEQAHQAICKEWVAAWDIKPSLPDGTRITQGVIHGVSKYMPAYYQVKQNGCTKEGRFLLVRFEDAKVLEVSPC